MKKKLLFLLLSLALDLDAMKEPEHISGKTSISSEINEMTEVHSRYESIMSDEEYSEFKQIIKAGKLNSEDPDYDYGCMRQAFDKAISLGQISRAIYFLLEGVTEQTGSLNVSLNNEYVKFTVNFLTTILAEKKAKSKAISNISERAFAKLSRNLNKKIKLLHYAIKKNKIDINQVNSSTCFGFNTSPLLLAIKLSSSPRLLRFLIAMGINVNVADSYGNTPLHMISSLPESNTNYAMIECLIDNGADIHAINNAGDTPFLTDNMINIIIFICVICVDPNSTNSSGDTLLNIVCSLPENEQNILFVKELLRNGADITIKNNAEFIPLRTAIAAKNHRIYKILTEANQNFVIQTKRDPKVKFSPSNCRRRTVNSDRYRRLALYQASQL